MNFEDKIEQATAAIKSRLVAVPKFGIVLGSGLGQVADSIENAIVLSYSDIPHFQSSTVKGHAGQLICGSFAGSPVIAMKGRLHCYEGHDWKTATLPIHAMCRLGIERLFLSNAAGGLNPAFEPGDVMMIDSHIDLLFRQQTISAPPPNRTGLKDSPNQPSHTDKSIRPIRSPVIYDRHLIEKAFGIARQEKFELRRGVYAAMLGPTYETRAEYRMLRQFGADAAGMSTVPEVIAASAYNIEIVGMSTITNVASTDIAQQTSHQEVVEVANIAQAKLESILTGLIRSA